MSHFYGTVQGARGEATRGGGEGSGLTTVCASWSGAIRCHAYVNVEGVDCVRVNMTTWRGRGTNHLIYDGPIGEFSSHKH